MSSRYFQNLSEKYFKDTYLQKDLPRSRFFREIYGQCKNLQEGQKFLKYQFPTLVHLLVAAYRGAIRTWRTSQWNFFFHKYLTVLSFLLFTQKRSIVWVMFEWVENRLLTQGLKILSLLLLPAYKLNPKNTQPENMCNIVFENAKVCYGTVNRTNVSAEAAVRWVL